MKSPYDIREDKVKIEGKPWDADEIRLLAAKKILQFNAAAEHNEWLISRGRHYYNLFAGNILTEEQRATYEDVEDKIVVEPPIMKAPVRALVGHTIKSRRSGSITTEDGTLDNPTKSADECAVVNAVLKDMEIKTHEKYLMRDAIHDSHVACYPNVLYFDKRSPSDAYDEGKLVLRHLPWDSCLFGPLTWRDVAGRDMSDLFWFEFRSQAQLAENFPDQAKNIEAHLRTHGRLDAAMLSAVEHWDTEASSQYRDTLTDIITRAYESWRQPSGFVPTVQHLFPIRRKEDVWVNIFDDSGMDFKIRPPEFSDEKWQKWLNENEGKYEGPYERDVRVLWMTVFTLSGLVLANEAHWYQECGRLPASIWIPAMISGMPTGLCDDLADDCLANCVAETEYLDDLRKGGGTLAMFKEGAVKNMEELPEEANKSFGIGIISKSFPGSAQDAFAEIRRSPNDTWKVYAEQRKASMSENTRVNETMQGASAPRQSAVAKELEIAQALIANALYIDNTNLQWEMHQNLKTSMIPYGYDEYQVLEIFDEDEQNKKLVEINSPEEFDEEGVPTRIVNDVTKRKYKWKINPVDDSASAKIQQTDEAIAVINGSAGPLIKADPTGKFFAKFLMSIPHNQILHQAGKAMAKDAQMSAEQQSKAQQEQVMREAQIELAKAQADLMKAQKQGVNVSFSGADLAEYPHLQKFVAGLLQSSSGQVQPQPQAPQPAPVM